MRGGAGQIVKWFGTCTDINDLKRAHADLRTMNQELDERVQQRNCRKASRGSDRQLESILSPEGDLGSLDLADVLDVAAVQLLTDSFYTYSVSHDLRAPLRHMSGFSKILTEEYGSDLPPEARHHLQRIEEGTRRMGLLVDDLLNLAQVRPSRSELAGIGIEIGG